MKYIKSKILFAMLALMIITLGSIIFIFYWYIRTTNNSMLSSSLEALSEQAAENFDYMINESVADFKNAATSSDYAKLITHDNRIEYLEELFADNTAVSSIAIYNSFGQIMTSTSQICPSLLSTYDVAVCSQRDTTMVTDVYEYENKNYFIVMVPLANDSQSIVSAVAIDCSTINERLANLNSSTQNEVFVVNSSGKVLFLSDENQVKLNQNPVELAKTNEDFTGLSEAITTAINGRSGSYSYNSGGKSYIMGYDAVSFFDSTIITVTDSQLYLAEYLSQGFTLIGVTVAVLFLLTLIFANFFSSSISKPIISTTTRLRKLANGDTSSSVDVWNSKDELGVLSNSLGETVSCLRLYINVIKHGLEQISRGNLTYRMTSGFKGDFSQIEQTFNDIFDQLCNTFDSINHSAEQVTSGAVQVANSAHSLSQGATQQASAIEELSATLSNVSDQVVQNSDSARNAYKIVDDNSHAIEDCNVDMDNLLEAMQLISETTEEVTQILKAIDEISFQTNILALNAAVEAAREGSKGFGVVADEVRRLAARTAEAAKQTSALIDKTSDAVSRGHSIAVKTAGSLKEVEEGSAKICMLMRNIADASAEQSDAILQINTGVDQISDVVAANTSAAIGSASASEELSGQSLILKNMIAKFKLYNGSGASVQSPKPSAARPNVSEQDYDFSIDLDNGPTAKPEAQPPKQSAPLPQAPGVKVEEVHVSQAGKNARAQMERVKEMFLKGELADDDDEADEDDSYYSNLEGLFGKSDGDEEDDENDEPKKKKKDPGGEDLPKANSHLKELFSKRDSDDDDDDDEPAPGAGSGKKDISALFKIDDDDDKY